MTNKPIHLHPNTKASHPLNRRDFIGISLAGATSLLFPWKRIFSATAAETTLVVVRGGTAAEAIQAAFKALGVPDRFDFRDKTAVVKPNIGWDRAPEQAANTDPELVGATVRILKNSGARVQVFDFTCNAAQRCYSRSGIEAAARDAGAEVSFVNARKFDETPLPDGQRVNSWPIYRDYVKADVRINLPVLKHHSLAGLTMGWKNLMGVMGGNRSTLHNGFDQKIVDVGGAILPEITVLDARRVLLRNGPTGGSLDDVKIMNTLIAGYNPVEVDAEGARLFGMDPEDLGYLREARRRGYGDFTRPQGFQEITLG
jgi:uncharacterized protein (DUF362 family)